MFPHTPDQVLTLGVTLVALTAAAAGATYDRSAGNGGSAGLLPATPANPAELVAHATAARAEPDTQSVGDRRCLTRREEDCLAEPVPFDEPHEAVCAVCHDMWDGTRTLIQSARSCSGGECHTEPAALAPFHRTVSPDVLDQCVACHTPHVFRVTDEGDNCTVCHTSGGSPVTWAGAQPNLVIPAELDFAHTDHGDVSCGTCHGQESRHGTLTVTDREDCRTCHHNRPLVNDCASCHVVAEVSETSFEVTKPLEITIGSLNRPVRTVTFHHADHWQHTQCGECHTGGIDLETAKGADCSGCHLEHHEPTATCTTCHDRPAEGAHDVNAHFGCGGTGCHDPVPEGIRRAPRTRELCLACHTDMADHKPEKTCSDCHVLPPAR